MRHPETSLFGSHFEMVGGDSKAQYIHNRLFRVECGRAGGAG